MTEPTLNVSSSEVIDPRRWAALAILLVGAFLAPLDFFIVNVAMPAITSGLRASAADVQLVISGYAVVYAVFLITGGRLGDIFGRKAVFLAGLAGFALASALCGLAWSPTSLIAGRLLQALAAAAMAPQALASVHALFPPHERGRALSIYGVTLGLASIAGQLLGGALVGANVDGFGWRLIFLINLPVAIVAFIAAIPLLRETRSGTRPRLDLVGVILSAATLTALVLPLIEGRERGWPWWSIAMLLTTPLFAEAFRRYEIRLAEAGGEPLVAIDAFASPGLVRGLGAIATLYALAAFFLTFSIYLQAGLGRTALEAGLAILPFSVGFLLGSFASPMVGNRVGIMAPSVGFGFSATGLVGLAAVAALSATGRHAAFRPAGDAAAIDRPRHGPVDSDHGSRRRRTRRAAPRGAGRRHGQFNLAGERGDGRRHSRRRVLRDTRQPHGPAGFGAGFRRHHAAGRRLPCRRRIARRWPWSAAACEGFVANGRRRGRMRGREAANGLEGIGSLGVRTEGAQKG